MRQKRLILFYVLFLAACNTNNVRKNDKLYIVTTTQMIKDAVKNIGGDKVEVVSLMGPGVDPHLYKATQGDLEKLMRADIIFYNGLHLEGKLQGVFEQMAKKKKVIPVSRDIDTNDLIELSRKGNEVVYDPHIWHSVKLWIQSLFTIEKALNEIDEENNNFYEANTKDYLNKLQLLDEEIRNKLAYIPKEQRLLITSHDAFNYFGKGYDIEVKGLQGISTVSEIGIKDVTDMVELLVKRKVKAVFVESSVPKKPLEAVIQGCKQKGHIVKIGGTLFSDAMGNENTPEGTYEGMIRFNATTMYNALK